MNTIVAPGRSSEPEAERNGSAWLPFKIAYPIVALVCLIQWHAASPWLRLDFFSGGYLLIRVLRVLRSVLKSSRREHVLVSQNERWGNTASPGWVNWALALTLGDLAVYLDYGHWQGVPDLKRPMWQAFGLLLYLLAAIWMGWTGRYLEMAFADNEIQPILVKVGPFRYVRHPYYAGAIVEKIAAALVFASVLGWLLVVLWSLLLLRQVRLEEMHMHRLFGREYEQYTRQSARLVPGIF